jgi:mono/diheme cytochrome c family protein
MRLRAALLLPLLAACGGQGGGGAPAPAGDALRGAALFRTSRGGVSCADCHSTAAEDQPEPGRVRVGHTLADGTRRPSWWHGTIRAADGKSVGDAIAPCAARFQERGEAGTPPLDAAARADLAAFLETVARPGPHLPAPAAIAGEPADLARVRALAGDAARGRAAFARACALCHRPEAGPDALAPTLRGKEAPERERVIDYVRRGPSGKERAAGAWMPPFTPDVLPDRDLAALAALIDGGGR